MSELTCRKVPHDNPIGGYLHDENDDSVFTVDHLNYCGRCHYMADENGRCQNPDNALPTADDVRGILRGRRAHFEDERLALHLIDLARSLATYARHKRTCNSLVQRYPCGAAKGRSGRCPNRATAEYHGTAITRGRERDVVYHRCDEHPLSNAKARRPLPDSLPCSCGLDALIADLAADFSKAAS